MGRAFGPASRPYRPSYVPNPKSRKYVINLDNWYAQSHPVEDFAEAYALYENVRTSPRRAEYRAMFPARFAYLDGIVAKPLARKVS